MPRRAKNIVADTGTITIATATSTQFRTRTSAGTAPDRRRATLSGSPAFARGSAGSISTYTHSADESRLKNAKLPVTAMTTCRPTSRTKAARRGTPGATMKNGAASSMPIVAAVDALCIHSGSWCAYHAIGVGIGCVS